MNFGKAKRIFVVDDDMMMREAMLDVLTRTVPHKVSVFSTGEECLKHIGEGVDVIVLDYQLNSVQKDAANRMEILETIKKYYPNVKVIMLSSQERYAVAMQTIQKGAEQYVIKDEKAFQQVADMINEF